jgi:hypothetical protein
MEPKMFSPMQTKIAHIDSNYPRAEDSAAKYFAWGPPCRNYLLPVALAMAQNKSISIV